VTPLVLALAIAVAPDPGRELQYPSYPPMEWVEKGVHWGESATASWRCASPFQAVIGWRNAGPWQQPMEFAWWFSPGFVASRLGFLKRREYWPQGELERRWTLIKAEVRDKVVFFVQLGASPQVDVLSGEQTGKARLDDLYPVRCVLKVGERVHDPKYQAAVWKQESRNFSMFTGFPWHQFTPRSDLLMGEFEAPLETKTTTFGEHHLMLYRVEFSIAELNASAEKMSLVVLSKNKDRIAEFSL
jgi:hypothetical protein